MKTIGLCFAMERHLISKWWDLVIPELKKLPVEWVNVPMDNFISGGTKFFGSLSMEWSDMNISARPPMAKTFREWKRFTKNRDVSIAIILLQVTVDVSPALLNNIGMKFDFLCELDIHVGATWSNYLTTEASTEVEDNWNVLKWNGI